MHGSRRTRISLAIGAALCASAPAHAQITTDGTLGAVQSFSGVGSTIPASLGKQAGGNLFHSFGQFSVPTGGSAVFAGPASGAAVSNVISRVTGGQASSINGRLGLAQEIHGANLFLVNPSGILFGANASLDLTGSFFASTANYLKLADGTRFDATATPNPILTSAPPAAFGFLGPTGSITVQGSQLRVAEGKSLSLVGGPVSVSGASLGTVAGSISLVAMGGAGEVPLAGDVLPGTALAPIAITRSTLSTESANGFAPGRILIRGGQLTVLESGLTSTNNEQVDAPPLDLAATGDLTVSASTISSETGWSGRGADIVLGGGNVTVDHNSQIGSITWGGGRGGDIALRAANAVRVVAAQSDPDYTNVYSWAFGSGAGGDLRLTGDTVTVQSANLYSYTGGSGAGGSIALRGREVGVTDGAWVYAYNGGGARGQSGSIDVAAAERLFLGRLDWYGNQAYAFTMTQGQGHAGSLRFAAPAIDVIGGRIQSYTLSGGNAGGLDFAGDVVRFHGGNGSFAMVDTTVGGGSTGNGGDINIRAAESFEISRGDQPAQWTRLSTSTFSSGRAGSINVDARSIRIVDGDTNNASIWAGSGGAGRGGDINLRGDDILLTGGTLVLAVNWGTGRGGDVSMRAPSVRIEGGSVHVQTDGPGDAGSILVEGEAVRLAGGPVRGGGIGSFNGYYSGGRGGDIDIRASRSFEIDGTVAASNIVSQTYYTSTGDAGNVTIESPRVTLTGPAMIYAPANGSGNGANVLIRAGDIELGAGTSIASDNPPWGGGRGGSITIEGTGRLTMAAAGAIAPFDHWHLHTNDAQIAAWTGGPGRAGDVTISIPEIRAHLNSQIVSYTFGSGDAGTITVNADRVKLVDTSAIVTSTELGSGNAGRIVLNIGERFEMSGRGAVDDVYAGFRLTSRGGVMSVSGGTGNAGSVVLRAPEVLLDDARIQTSTRLAGRGGQVAIQAGELVLRNGGQIDAKSLAGSTGDAGSIVLDIGGRLEISGVSGVDGGFSGVNAETLGEGRGGSVKISAGTLVVDRGFIRSSTGASGNAGTVDVRAQDVLLVNGGAIDAGTAPGSSGTGGSVNVAATGSIIVRGVDGSAVVPVVVTYENPVFAGFFTPGRPQGAFPSSIATNTAGSGSGGNVTLSAPSVRIEDGARVSATSTGTGNAGSISIAAADALRIFGGSTISSEALRADGGNIDIRVGNLVHLRNSEITTAVGSGQGAGGNIFIDPTFVILENSKITANAFGGPGGNIQIIATYFLNTLNSLVDASSQAGLPGTVSISAPNTNLSTQLKVLPAAFFDATQLVREACAGRGVAAGNGGSSLVGVGRGGLAASPERFATSTYFGGVPAAVASAPEPTGLKLVSTKHARLAANCAG